VEPDGGCDMATTSRSTGTRARGRMRSSPRAYHMGAQPGAEPGRTREPHPVTGLPI
jgi:hypothetical protein